MEYQKTINLVNHTPNQPSKFQTSRGTNNENNQIRF